MERSKPSRGLRQEAAAFRKGLELQLLAPAKPDAFQAGIGRDFSGGAEVFTARAWMRVAI